MTTTTPTPGTTAPSTVTDADRAYVRGLYPELEGIRDAGLAAAVVDIWVETWKASSWKRIEDAPKNPETVELRHSLVTHTRAVTLHGIALAKTIGELHGLPADLDLVIAGCNLHDVSKLVEYAPQAAGPASKSKFGKLVQHASFGVHKALEHGLSLELVHIIGSHTTQSRLAPATLEAVIVYYADYADSDALMLEAGHKLLLSAAR